MRDQARRNALRLAYVRVVALCVAVALDAAFYFFPRQTIGVEYVSPANVGLAAFWLAVALGIAVALRSGSYSRRWRISLALLDPVIVLTLFALIFESLRGTPKIMHPVVVTGAAFTLLAVTGALAHSKPAAALSGLLSVLGFGVVAAVVGYSLAEALFVCGIVGCAGLLGMRLAENTRRAVSAEASRVILRRFLPPHLAEGDPAAVLSAVSRPRHLEATVLVSDLRGFTASVEKLDPQAALDFLNDVQGALAACVQADGGTVDKFMGDGMLAVFGAPEPLADHAAASLRAALAMRREIARLNATRVDSGRPPLRIGIGIHSGPVVAGCVGSGERLEFTVIGDTVNTASRLEAETKERDVDILLSDATRVMALPGVREPPSLIAMGEIVLRGKERRIRAFRVA